MFNIFRGALGATAVLACLAFGAPSHAITLSKQNASDTFDGGGRLAVTLKGGPRDVSALAGGFRVTDGAENFIAWCLDIATNLSLPSDYTTTTTPFAASIGAFSDTVTSNIQKLFDTSYSTLDLDGNKQSGAFQLALWEILYETSGTFDLTAGTFYQSRTGTAQDHAETIANGFLAGLDGPVTQRYRLTFWESIGGDGAKRSQNLVSVEPIPLPAAAWMLIAGVGALAGTRRFGRG